MRTLGKIALATMLAGAVLLLAGAVSAYWFSQSPAGEDVAEKEITFQIEKGESYRSVAARLAGEGLIRSELLFLGLGKVRGTLTQLKSGNYRLSTGMSAPEIHDILVSGEQKLFRVTLPEGLTVDETAARFAEQGICSKQDFIAAALDSTLLEEHGIKGPSAEGFLYPDTYLFQQDYPAEKVVEHLISRFFNKLREIAPEYVQEKPRELYRKVIIASIVEREYRAADEAKRIASVFYNRLARSMPLQSCATVVYTITEELGRPHPTKLTYNDLEIASPYNTYQHQGLPPTPIANPGEIALRAAFHPAETEYLYFLLRDADAGEHEFSRSFSEHNRAYRLYIKEK